MIILLGLASLYAGLLLSAGFGLAMALPVGLVCAWLANRKGLSGLRCGAAGAAYTVLFFLPGVYFAIRLLGRRVSPALVGTGYVMLYGCWIGLTGMVGVPYGFGSNFVVMALIIAFITMIVVSGYLLLQRYNSDNAPGVRTDAEAGPPQSLFLERVYLLPLTGAYVSMILHGLFFHRSSPFAHLVE